MRICCFPFLCFGEGEIDKNMDSHYSMEGKDNTEEVDLGKENGGVENDDSKSNVGEDFKNAAGVEGDELGLQTSSGKANSKEKKPAFSFEFDDEKKFEFLRCMKEVGLRCANSYGGGNEGARWDVDLNLDLIGEPSSSLTAYTEQDTQNKRAKLQSLALGWEPDNEKGIHYITPVHEPGYEDVAETGVPGEDASNENDNSSSDDMSEVRMDLTDDLLHMVLSFLGHIDLCRAAHVCTQWRDASSHEDFWRYLNFENKHISEEQFEDMCQRYPNATALNVYGTRVIHSFGIKSFNLLRNLEVLTLGKGQLGETFFQALTDCHTLRSLTINDAMLGTGLQEIPIQHDRLHDLQIVKCRVLRVSIRCPQLETLSLKRSSMPNAVLNCPLLRELDIASCHKLLDAAIRSAVTSCPLLESLDISNCSCVSDETLQGIAFSCANLHILDASYCPNIALESVTLSMLTVLKLHSCEGITSASMASITYQASAIRNSEERNTRLENMCWRIWTLARKKKQIEGEEAQRKAKKRLEREKARKQAAADMSEDLSEGEKGDTVGELPFHGDSVKGKMSRVNSVDTMANLDKKLYLVLISLHGLIRGENMELGRDSDTGGQVKYVVELARALGSMPGVYRVDLLTRQVMAPDVDWTYGEPTEMLTPLSSHESEMDETGESSGAYIIRIPFGPKDKYLSKEVLWPHIPEFVDGALGHLVQMSKVLGKQIGSDQPLWPIAIHGHYADAGNSAALLSGVLNVPMVFTGHSLGRDKLEQLLKQGRQSREEIDSVYKIMRRIEAEEISLDVSEVIITSTRQEIEEQWRLYDGFDPVLERKLRARIKRNVSSYGRIMPRMVVIPPGMEFRNVVPPHDGDTDGEIEGNENSKDSDPPIWSEIMRFFTNPRKPMILALARPDPKKNLITLVKAFGECRPLRDLANLTLIMGNRDDIDGMSATNSSVLLSIIKLIDKYDLYGQVAYPKHHNQTDVPEIYRLAAKTKGVFINPAYIEPFGLTLIEAAARGLPIVATKNGGPVDIHRVLDNGVLVDPHDQESIADALLKLVADKHLWARCRESGLRNIHRFSWPEHCRTYLARITSCKQRQPKWQRPDNPYADPGCDSPGGSLRDINDLSLNLKLSLESDRAEGITNVVIKGQETTATQQQVKVSQNDQKQENCGSSSRLPALNARKLMLVIAVDCDSVADVLAITKIIFAAAKDCSTSTGFILSTSYSISEINSHLEKAGLKSSDFDAYICNSGSEIYFSSPSSEQSSSESQYLVDTDYHSQTEYHWGGESLRNNLVRWADSVNEKTKDDASEGPVITELDSGSSHCYGFRVRDPALVPPFRELRRLMRIQALRCNGVYCRNGEMINVIPVLASRAQALRYLHVRWGMELTKVVVFVGELGDSDYEGNFGGLHKTVILKGYSLNAAKIHSTGRSYPLHHVVPATTDHDPKTVECQKPDVQGIKALLSLPS